MNESYMGEREREEKATDAREKVSRVSSRIFRGVSVSRCGRQVTRDTKDSRLVDVR